MQNLPVPSLGGDELVNGLFLIGEFRGQKDESFGFIEKETKVRKELVKNTIAIESADGTPVQGVQMWDPAKGEKPSRFELVKGQRYGFLFADFKFQRGASTGRIKTVVPLAVLVAALATVAKKAA